MLVTRSRQCLLCIYLTIANLPVRLSPIDERLQVNSTTPGFSSQYSTAGCSCCRWSVCGTTSVVHTEHLAIIQLVELVCVYSRLNRSLCVDSSTLGGHRQNSCTDKQSASTASDAWERAWRQQMTSEMHSSNCSSWLPCRVKRTSVSSGPVLVNFLIPV